METAVEKVGQSRSRTNLREKAYESFTERLLARDIRPGQFISQRELVALTGLTLGAVRELIPRLEAEGLIKTVPQRGMQVAHVDLNLIRDAFQLRLFLEREATAIFATEASHEVVAQLRESHESVLAAARSGPITPELVARAQAVDWELHWSVISSLRNDIIADIYRVNSIKIRLIRQDQTLLSESIVAPVMQEHLSIISAIETRDPALAVAAMSAHITSAAGRALGLK